MNHHSAPPASPGYAVHFKRRILRFMLITAGVWLGMVAAVAVKAGEGRKDLITPAVRALHGFMMHCPNPVPDHPDLYRAVFSCQGLPVPKLAHAQWDWGDCTARAVEDWLWLREMTGDQHTGRHVEQGQWAALLWVLHPQTGLAFVPDRSNPAAGIYHYQMWDQGRTLRALVHRWLAEYNEAAKRDWDQKIRRMIQGLEALARHGTDPRFGNYAVYPFDFLEGERQGHDILCLRGGQLLEPLALYWQAQPQAKVRQFAEELYAGVLSGQEGASADPAHRALFTFGEDGSFSGHFHAHMSTVLGVARWGVALYRQGEPEEGLRRLRWAKKVYDWTLHPTNINAGSTWGWFPEHLGPDNSQSREMSETCCTADMIELAAVLAASAEWDASLRDWDALWDHVERYTINYLLHTQFFVRPEYARLVKRWGPSSRAVDNGYIRLEVDPAGCFNHETAGGQTLRRGKAGHLSQLIYGAAVGKQTSTFFYKYNQPIQNAGFTLTKPSRAVGNRLISVVEGLEGRLRIEGTVQPGNGPSVRWRYRITNLTNHPLNGLRFAQVLNLDTSHWQHDQATTDRAQGRLLVKSANDPCRLGVQASPPPACLGAADAGLALADPLDWSTASPQHEGNAAALIGWQIDQLRPGETREFSLLIAVAADETELLAALHQRPFPALTPPTKKAPDDTLETARRMEGTWISQVMPNQVISYDNGQPVFYTGGCCGYSGVRGLYACWKAALNDDGQRLNVRLPIDRQAESVTQTVTETDTEVRQQLKLKQARHVRLRLPDWADTTAAVVRANGRPVKPAVDHRWLDLGEQPPGTTITIRYPLSVRTTTERLGGSGQGLGFSPPESKRTFHIYWRGNRVVRIHPPGKADALPLFAEP